jgi:DNA repair exonuclease SbcCD nuclease subunit
MIPGKMLSKFKDFDYIAMGHWHCYLPLKNISNAYYSGSTERFSFREVGYPKGAVLVDLETHKAELCPVEVREMVLLGPVDCAGKGAAEVMELIVEAKTKTGIDGKIVQLRLENMARSTYVQLDLRKVRNFLAEAFYVDIHPDLVSESGKVEESGKSIGALPIEFEHFLTGMDLPGIDKRALAELGLRYIGKAQEQEQL